MQQEYKLSIVSAVKTGPCLRASQTLYCGMLLIPGGCRARPPLTKKKKKKILMRSHKGIPLKALGCWAFVVSSRSNVAGIQATASVRS